MSGIEKKQTITVVIASYKYGHLAAHCIESVLGQSVLPDKILFVDDGIGDCDFLPELYPNIDYVFRKKNLGTVANFSDMLSRVNTEKCLFLGADNWLRSDSIELFLQKDTDIVTYDIIVTGELKHDVLNRHPDELSDCRGDFYWSRFMKHHGSMVYDVSIAKKLGYHANKNSEKSEEDLVLWHSMIKVGATVSHIDEGLLFYRRHKSNFNNYLINKKQPNFFVKGLKRLKRKIKLFIKN